LKYSRKKRGRISGPRGEKEEEKKIETTTGISEKE